MCLFLICIGLGCKPKNKAYQVVDNHLQHLQEKYTNYLQQAISSLESIEQSANVQEQIVLYKKARTSFKKAEPMLGFFESESYKSLNAPNILKVEEEDATNIKIFNPFGFQVIEELLHEDAVNQEALKNVVKKTKNRLRLLAHNNQLHAKNYHILWLVRDQIARTALTGITGFDSPVLEQSLEEAKTVYQTLREIIELYKPNFSNTVLYENWMQEFAQTQKDLSGNFNEFDRYTFIKNHSHKQLELLQETAKDWKVDYPLELAFNNDMTSLFSKETFNIDFFSNYTIKNDHWKEKVVLGKQLFNDKRLSKNNTMSCATCHQEQKAFTDGLPNFSKQKRNTPTLTYASLQKAFFYDARSGSLEGQIVSVVNNKDEFHTTLNHLDSLIKNDAEYIADFEKLYGKVNNSVARNAIATYIKSLNKFNSKFDKNINNTENTLTTNEIEGFNLFMGKGKCATCHFPPVFNGTVPPNFTDTELEAIGVPNKKKTALSDDLGRYDFFKTEERKHFFKTSTVRNIKKTAPYMHNGTYKTLEEVMDFYNNGGGIGLGFELEHQTLPPDSLHLSKKEIANIIEFMHSLTDE